MIKAFKPYIFLIVLITIFTTLANLLSLYLPKKIGSYIDIYQAGQFNLTEALLTLGTISLLILLLTLGQAAVATFTSEKVSFDLRNKIIGALKGRSFSYMRDMTGGRLVTVATSDVDAVKNMVSNGIPPMIMSLVTIVGVIFFLLSINWQLALATLAILPFMVLLFFFVFGKMGPLFNESQENLDNINKTINESIIASALVRVLNAFRFELAKFNVVNRKGAEISQKVVIYFAALIPVVTILANIALLVILWFGGSEVVRGDMTIGELSAFFAYTSVFVWPFFILSFSGTLVARANVSLGRIDEVLEGELGDGAPSARPFQNSSELSKEEVEKVYSSCKEDGVPEIHGSRTEVPRDDSQVSNSSRVDIQGHIVFKDVTLKYGEKAVLENISFEIQPRTRTAIIGPTGAGKTELFYLMAGLAEPSEGEILVDGKNVKEWNQSELLSQIGMVFQDSVMFNTTFKENILFKSDADEKVLGEVIEVSDLTNLVKELPRGLETHVSERGVSLSGGQKQRIMLARALAIRPRILLLDDFTARVDVGTEERILKNIKDFYRDLTLISITQKIEPIKDYDHIIVLMEGELIAQGKHQQLLADSIEYRQIYESQHSTESHE